MTENASQKKARIWQPTWRNLFLLATWVFPILLVIAFLSPAEMGDDLSLLALLIMVVFFIANFMTLLFTAFVKKQVSLANISRCLFLILSISFITVSSTHGYCTLFVEAFWNFVRLKVTKLERNISSDPNYLNTIYWGGSMGGDECIDLIVSSYLPEDELRNAVVLHILGRNKDYTISVDESAAIKYLKIGPHIFSILGCYSA